MELQALQTFIAVVDEGGVAAASKKLFTVQSNVTNRIKRLEQELGVDLFYRQGRGLTRTPAGRVLYDYAGQLLHLERSAVSAVRQAGEVAGELRIGSMESFAAVRLPAALMHLRESYPLLVPAVQTNTSAALVDDVLSHRLDCAFVGGVVEHPDLQSQVVLDEELVEVSSADVEAKHTLIVFRQGCAYRAKAEAWMRSQGRPDFSTMELGTLEGILGCVAVGLGVTVMSRYAVEKSSYVDKVCCKSLGGAEGVIPTSLVWHRRALGGEIFGCLAGVFSDHKKRSD